MTAFLTIRDAIAARLTEAPALAGVPVFKGRRRPIPAEIPRAFVVRINSANGQAAGISNGPTDWSTGFVVECHAVDDEDAEAAVDELIAHAFQRLSTLQIPGLGMMDIAALPDIEWDPGESVTNHVCATFVCRATHRTLGTELNPWS